MVQAGLVVPEITVSLYTSVSSSVSAGMVIMYVPYQCTAQPFQHQCRSAGRTARSGIAKRSPFLDLRHNGEPWIQVQVQVQVLIDDTPLHQFRSYLETWSRQQP